MSYGGPDDFDLPDDPWADADPDVVEPEVEAPEGVSSEPAEVSAPAPDLDFSEPAADLEFAEPAPAEPDPAVVADLQAVASIERDLLGVDAALRRLDDGTYGTCVSCGRPIEAATLEANPIEDHCAHCDPAQGRLAGL